MKFLKNTMGIIEVVVEVGGRNFVQNDNEKFELCVSGTDKRFLRDYVGFLHVNLPPDIIKKNKQNQNTSPCF